VALSLSKQLEKKPREVAEIIIQNLSEIELPFIDKMEVAGPGFINFWFAEDTLLDNLNRITSSGDDYGSSPNDIGQKIMVEFTDPNPFKEFHIGHLYSNTVGEALSRLFESQRAEVMRVCYQGDVGLHVAKALYGILHDEVGFMELEHADIQAKAKFLGKAYAFGAASYEESEEAKHEINAINKKIYERNDPDLIELYDLGRHWSLEYFETLYERLGTKFQKYYFESVAGPIGLEIVKKNIGNVFKEDNGAVIFPGKDYGLHNRVFINSLGLPTYEAKELGLAPTKYHDFPYDISVIVTGNEINEYFKVLLKALSLVNPELAAKTVHIGHGMVRLPEGKMSSRTGNVITGEWLLNEAKSRILKTYPSMSHETAEMVAVGAIKYALLKNGIGGDISFSFEESISLSGNSGPYLQYTYARTRSVAGKAGLRGQKSEDRGQLEAEEKNLLRLLIQFPSILEKAAIHYAPNTVAGYLFELAGMFNLFYQKHQIVKSDKEEFRLHLTASVGQVIKNGLHVLGIRVPEHM
jgi:arginyl-tRNA synthetase